MEKIECTGCKEHKPLSEFYSNPEGKHKVDPRCRECKSAYHKLRYQSQKKEKKVITIPKKIYYFGIFDHKPEVSP